MQCNAIQYHMIWFNIVWYNPNKSVYIYYKTYCMAIFSLHILDDDFICNLLTYNVVSTGAETLSKPDTYNV